MPWRASVRGRAAPAPTPPYRPARGGRCATCSPTRGWSTAGPPPWSSGDDPRTVDDAALEAEGRSAGDQVGWLHTGADALLAALRAAPDDLDVMTFLAQPLPAKAFWARRQCHETTVHALDALSALEGRTPSSRRRLALRRARHRRRRRAARGLLAAPYQGAPVRGALHRGGVRHRRPGLGVGGERPRAGHPTTGGGGRHPTGEAVGSPVRPATSTSGCGTAAGRSTTRPACSRSGASEARSPGEPEAGAARSVRRPSVSARPAGACAVRGGSGRRAPARRARAP